MAELRNIKEINKDLKEAKTAIKLKEKEIKDMFLKIKDVFHPIKDKIRFDYSTYESRASFYIEFTGMLSLRCFLTKKNTVVNTKEYIKYEREEVINSKFNNEKSRLLEEARLLLTIAECRKDLTEKLLFDTLIGLKKKIPEVQKLRNKKSRIKEERELFKQQYKFEYLDKIIRPLGEFCLYKYLAKEFGISLEKEKPSRKEIQEIKDEFERRSKYKDFKFIIRQLNSRLITIADAKLTLYQGKWNLYANRRTYNTVKSINKELANQFTYKGTFVEYKNSVQNIKITNFRILDYSPKQYYQRVEYDSAYIDDLFESDDFKKELLQYNIEEF